jgi:hypothetical protein
MQNKKQFFLSGVCVGIGLLLAMASEPVQAHHAFSAEFDSNQPVTFEGSVIRMEWINPHCWIHIEIEAEDGMMEEWAIETGTPNVLFRRGLTKDALLPGTVVTIAGYKAKDGSRRANGRDVTFADGTTAFVGSSGTGAPYEAP